MNELKFNQINADKLDSLLCATENIDEIKAVNCVYHPVEELHSARCPHCGESYYMETHSMITAVYYPPIYKNGVNINPDRNKSTTYCACMNCGKDFSF